MTAKWNYFSNLLIFICDDVSIAANGQRFNLKIQARLEELSSLFTLCLLRTANYSTYVRPLPMHDGRVLFLSVPFGLINAAADNSNPVLCLWASERIKEFREAPNLTHVQAAVLEIESQLGHKLRDGGPASALIAAWIFYQRDRLPGEDFFPWTVRRKIEFFFGEKGRPEIPKHELREMELQMESIFISGEADSVNKAAKVLAERLKKISARSNKKSRAAQTIYSHMKDRFSEERIRKFLKIAEAIKKKAPASNTNRCHKSSFF